MTLSGFNSSTTLYGKVNTQWIRHKTYLSLCSSERVLFVIINNHGVFFSFVCFSINSHMLPRISVDSAQHNTSLTVQLDNYTTCQHLLKSCSTNATLKCDTQSKTNTDNADKNTKMRTYKHTSSNMCTVQQVALCYLFMHFKQLQSY